MCRCVHIVILFRNCATKYSKANIIDNTLMKSSKEIRCKKTRHDYTRTLVWYITYRTVRRLLRLKGREVMPKSKGYA